MSMTKNGIIALALVVAFLWLTGRLPEVQAAVQKTARRVEGSSAPASESIYGERVVQTGMIKDPITGLDVPLYYHDPTTQAQRIAFDNLTPGVDWTVTTGIHVTTLTAEEQQIAESFGIDVNEVATVGILYGAQAGYAYNPATGLYEAVA